MRVILVDDERLALASLNSMLQNIDNCAVIGMFRNAEEAIARLGELRPDVVFLDIHMPGMNGLEAIESIRAIVPDIEIVLVTAHAEYALNAFGLDVLDYVLKPLSRERLHNTVQRLKRRLSPEQPALFGGDPDCCARVHCLGMLRLQRPFNEPIVLNWRTAKIKELFSYLLHRRFKRVSMDILLELLWPELDEQRGRMNLHTGIYQLRRILKQNLGEPFLTIRYSNSGYILEGKQLRIDAAEWEQELRTLPPLSQHTASVHRKAFDRYEGPYFGDERYSWAEQERLRLHALWAEQADLLAQFYMETGKESEAISVYYRIQQLDPLLPLSYTGLMALYARSKDAHAFEAQYAGAVKTYSEEAGGAPPPYVTDCYQLWRKAEFANS